MKKLTILTLLIGAGIATLFDPFSSNANEEISGFQLTSETISAGKTLPLEQVYNGFGCVGNNISPALMWQEAPKGTKSFAITAYDPDAPTGSGWWHWLVFNIPGDLNALPVNAAAKMHDVNPMIKQGRNDYGDYGYGGACPPKGTKAHQYIFTIHALSVPHLDLNKDATAAMIGYNIKANELGRAELVATYGR